MSKTVLLTTIAVLACGLTACESKYECIERTQKEVPNFQAPGTHTEVDYVLLHDGHKIYAICDIADLGSLDPSARCGFRPLRKYECTLQPDTMEKGTFPL